MRPLVPVQIYSSADLPADFFSIAPSTSTVLHYALGGLEAGREGVLPPELAPQPVPGKVMWRLQNARKHLAFSVVERERVYLLEKTHNMAKQ